MELLKVAAGSGSKINFIGFRTVENLTEFQKVQVLYNQTRYP